MATPAPSADEITAFVWRYFGLRGTWRLHRSALGWDLLRAPANVALAPLHLIVRVLALLLRLIGLRRAAGWLARRRMFFPSDVARRVGTAIRTELYADAPLSPAQFHLIAEYTTTRTAIAEIVTSLTVLTLGLYVFQVLTPGVLSLAPVLTETLAESRAIADFPLGQRLGRAYYAVFPLDLSAWRVVAMAGGLILVASLVTTFAGLIADPLQAATGLHRRRLNRLTQRIAAQAEAPTLPPEHLLARTGDLTDLAVSLARLLKP